MNRQELVLSVLGAANGNGYSPAQLQKALFLIDRNLPGIVANGDGFQFQPYDYGPFDRGVYVEADALAANGLARIERSASSGYRTYSASEDGIRRAAEHLASLNEAQRNYIETVSGWVRSMSFAKLVKSIYEEYPEMRANSIFVG